MSRTGPDSGTPDKRMSGSRRVRAGVGVLKSKGSMGLSIVPGFSILYVQFFIKDI